MLLFFSEGRVNKVSDGERKSNRFLAPKRSRFKLTTLNIEKIFPALKCFAAMKKKMKTDILNLFFRCFLAKCIFCALRHREIVKVFQRFLLFFSPIQCVLKLCSFCVCELFCAKLYASEVGILAKCWQNVGYLKKKKEEISEKWWLIFSYVDCLFVHSKFKKRKKRQKEEKNAWKKEKVQSKTLREFVRRREKMTVEKSVRS